MLHFKMKKFRYQSIIFVVALVTLYSCTREVAVNLPPYSSKIVVNGLISDKDVSKVQISSSISSLDTNPINYIYDGTAQLYNEQDVLYDILSYDAFSSGYIGTKPVVPGVFYTLKVNVKGKQVIGTTRILAGAKIMNLAYQDMVRMDSTGLPIGEVSFSFNDDGSIENYYRLNVLYYDNTRSEFKALDIKDNYFLVIEAEQTNSGFVFKDRTFNGAIKKLNFEVPYGYIENNAPYKFVIILETLNEDYSRYENSRSLYNQRTGTPFSESVELYSNIKGGLGIFAGANVSRDTLK